jgi:hypothetical protein
VGNSRPVHTDIVVIIEVKEFLPCKLGAFVSDDRVGYAEAVNDVGGEGYRLLRADIDNGSRLDPFEELVNRYKEMSEASECLSERPHHVEVPDGERPRDGDGLKRLRREVSLSSVELTPFTASYDVLGVRHHCGPVESLSESLSDKCSRTSVMTASAGVYLS